MLLTLPIMFALYWPISQPLKYLMNLSAAQIDAVRDQLILIGARVNGVLVSATSSEMTLVRRFTITLRRSAAFRKTCSREPLLPWNGPRRGAEFYDV